MMPMLLKNPCLSVKFRCERVLMSFFNPTQNVTHKIFYIYQVVFENPNFSVNHFQPQNAREVFSYRYDEDAESPGITSLNKPPIVFSSQGSSHK